MRECRVHKSVRPHVLSSSQLITGKSYTLTKSVNDVEIPKTSVKETSNLRRQPVAGNVTF
jgi:hypothetical protein